MSVNTYCIYENSFTKPFVAPELAALSTNYKDKLPQVMPLESSLVASVDDMFENENGLKV